MKALTLILALTYITTVAQAQLCEKADCDRLKNYCNTRITNAYIKGYVIKKNKNDSLNYEKIREKVFAGKTHRNPSSYDDLSNALSSDFSKTKEKLTDKINAVVIGDLDESSPELSGQVFVNRIDSAISKDIKSQIKDYEKLKSNLREELINEFKQFIPQNEQPEEVEEAATMAGRAKPSEEQRTDNTGNHSGLSRMDLADLNAWIVLLLALNTIVFGFAVYTYRRVRNIETDRASKTGNGNSNNRSSERNQLSFEVSSIRSEVAASKAEISELKQTLNEIKALLDKPKVESPGIEIKETQSTNGIDQDTTFYMAFPIGNYFLNKGKSSSKPDTFYTFQVNPNNRNEANFYIHAGEAMIKEYITMSEECIKPACQEQNVASSSVKKIITKHHGTAVLDGDKWIIKTKAVIHYE